MKTPKNLDMDKVNKLFDEHFTVDKAELDKGITMWSLTPKRDPQCPKCGTKLMTGKLVSEGYDFYCPECDEDFYNVEAK